MNAPFAVTGVLVSTGRRGDFDEFTIAGTKVATKKPEVAQSAYSLVGREVEATVTQTQREKDGRVYTNSYLMSVIPAQGAPPPQVGAGGPSSSQPAPTPPVVSAALPGGPVEEREMRIMRQSAARTAVDLLSFEQRTIPELIDRAEELLAYFLNGRVS